MTNLEICVHCDLAIERLNPHAAWTRSGDLQPYEVALGPTRQRTICPLSPSNGTHHEPGTPTNSPTP